MEETQEPIQPVPSPKKKHHHPQVIIVRDWKEYLGESALIIFSVLLALILTEVISKIHEQQETKQFLKDIRDELIENKKREQEQYAYHMQVLKNIDSALHNIKFQEQIVTNQEFNLNLIAPDGILYRYLYDVAWQIAKQHDIASKIDIEDMSILTHIYEEQGRIMKSEEEIAKIIFDRQSRDPANTRVTLILMRDNYHGWAVDRVKRLMEEYQTEIDKLK